MFFFNPLEHFEFNLVVFSDYFFSDFFVVTSASIMLVSVNVFFFFFYFFLRKKTIFLKKSVYFIFMIYSFFLNIFKEQIVSIRAFKFFPFIFALFFFIFFLNFASLFVFNISITAHIFITFFFGLTVFLALVIIAFLNYGKTFFYFFVPDNVPKFLLYFIIFIEVISFIIRPFSLSIRLFANMLAGHTLLSISAQFLNFIFKNFFLLFLLPLFFLIAVFALEFVVSIIQAYIFVNLLIIYLNDVYSLH